MKILKNIAAIMPNQMQNELKRIYYRRQISKKKFVSPEPEYEILEQYIQPNDWAIDIGANVGHYTKRLSDLVGPYGRVIAFEPVPSTFSLLAANVQLLSHPNVTLINAAVSDNLNEVGMNIPQFSTGLTNYYEAHLISTDQSHLRVLSLSIDSLSIKQRIALVKIDAEGHEYFVLDGMRCLLEKFHPILIVETDSEQIVSMLSKYGYVPKKLHNSPNIVFCVGI